MLIAVKAYAKINWALSVAEKRADGYHEMDMLMQSVSLADEITFEPCGRLELTVNGGRVAPGAKNLVMKAATALNEYTGRRMGAKMRLTKRIPVCAGLGGGSADCAATLKALNRLWRLNLPRERLLEIGARLGADVPFCMEGGLMRVRGFGEKLERLSPAPIVPLVILHPGMGLSTAKVFGAWDALETRPAPIDMDEAQSAIRAGDIMRLALCGGNSLEAPSLRLMPAIADAMRAMKESGAVYARMSGSGSAVFGAYADADAALRAKAILGARAIFAETRPKDEI